MRKPRSKDPVLVFADDRPLAHSVLFAGQRHANQTPEFHKELITDFHSAIKYLCWIVFRGGGKSTIAEEGMTLAGALREFFHCFIVGASAQRAEERLHSVRRQFEKNELLRHTFGDLVGKPWADDRLELSTGRTLQALGRGQAIRGTKNEDFRPDLIIVDDIEDAQSVSTPDGRKKVADWFFDELLPSGDAVKLKVRVLANDMHPECLANQLEKPGSGFVVRRYPWEYRDAKTGERKPTWPDRFPLDEIDRTQARYYSQGNAGGYMSNYMCRSESPADKPFRRDMFRYAGRDGVEPYVRTWQPVYVMIDPARKVSATAATTGIAVWSRINNRLVVWDASAKKLMPDEIIRRIFEINEEFRPVKIGFEEDGLNEWALQPIRAEQAKRGMVLPMVPVKAPKGKLDFIRGLQFGFTAREIVFAKPLPDLEAQLIGFPSGYIDAPNALAYEHHPKLAVGTPVYEDFGMQNVVDGLPVLSGKPAWLCLNATPSLLTAQLVQFIDGVVRVLADWQREGEPSASLTEVFREANLEAEQTVRLVCGPSHFERYGNSGLVPAAKRIPAEVRRAPVPETGRNEARLLLRKMSRGLPAFLVSGCARWTLNGLAGGYARMMLRGQLMEFAEEGPYKVLMEGLESFLGMMHSVGEQPSQTNATASDGRQFFSAVAHRRA